MKYIVNGSEAELKSSDAIVRRVNDYLMVSGADGTHSALAVRKGDITYVSYRGRQYLVEPFKAARETLGAAQSGEIRSPMPGQVVDVHVGEGDDVKHGEKMLVLEAMKTQQTFVAPFDGRIAKLTVSKGEQVDEGLVMVLVEPVKERSIE
ncbi:MAG: hypothetical protein BGO01_15200 [Armatimonadetes bacterium 55-13]|nr:hypothetical protein [Armatimonadota bacterium]OJU65214.1 MAG: hypothetical protein BGO01_15200 [Armatimonadetes bacterium 55-13]